MFTGNWLSPRYYKGKAFMDWETYIHSFQISILEGTPWNFMKYFCTNILFKDVLQIHPRLHKELPVDSDEESTDMFVLEEKECCLVMEISHFSWLFSLVDFFDMFGFAFSVFESFESFHSIVLSIFECISTIAMCAKIILFTTEFRLWYLRRFGLISISDPNASFENSSCIRLAAMIRF